MIGPFAIDLDTGKVYDRFPQPNRLWPGRWIREVMAELQKRLGSAAHVRSVEQVGGAIYATIKPPFNADQCKIMIQTPGEHTNMGAEAVTGLLNAYDEVLRAMPRGQRMRKFLDGTNE